MPRIPLIPTLVVAAVAGPAMAADLSDVQFHGFASQGYLYTTNNNYYGRTTDGGSFEFNEFGLNVLARPIDRLRVAVQVFAGDQGKYGNDELKLDWAYGTYDLPMPVKWADLSVTGGRFKAGHGLYNDYRDLDMTRTTVFLPMTVYPTTFRDLYLAINGFQGVLTLRAGAIGSFDLSGCLGTQQVDHRTGTPVADNFGQGYFDLTRIDVKRVEGGFLQWNTPVEGLRFKGSVLHASDITANGIDQQGVGFTVAPGVVSVTTLPNDAVVYELPTWQSIIISGELQRGDLTIAAEYLNEYYKALTYIDASTRAMLAAIGQPAPAEKVTYQRIQGAYLSAAYRIHPKWEVSLGGSWMMYDNTLDRSVADDDLKRNEHRGASVAVRFDPTEHWLIKAEFQRNRGTLNISSRDNADGMSLYWNLFALKTTFDF